MFSASLSRRARLAAAIAGAPAVAVAVAVAAPGVAHATGKGEPRASAIVVSADSASGAAATAPATGQPVLIKAPRAKNGKARIVTVNSKGGIDLSRSKPTASGGLSAQGTWMVLLPVGDDKEISYQIMSLNDSEEKDAYCLTQKMSGKLGLAVCDESKGKQLFRFSSVAGKKFTIGGYWGPLKADKRQLRTADVDRESVTYFRVVVRS